jgi:hypothetical protein
MRTVFIYACTRLGIYLFIMCNIVGFYGGGKTSYLAVGRTVLGGRKNVLYVFFNNKNSRVMRECSELCEVHHRTSFSSCMYIYVCVYTYIYVFMSIYMCLVYISVYIHMCLYVRMGVLYIYMYTLILLQACGGQDLIFCAEYGP